MSEANPVRKEAGILIMSVFIAGLCSIVYELLISTTTSYFLGDSIKQFSITIGLYMAAMGIGAYVSRGVKGALLPTFVIVEIALGFLGGVCIPILYLVYAAAADSYYFVMVLLVLCIGILIGLEVPLLTRIMERYYTLKVNISNVLSLDYFGALVATLLFPFVIMPFVGLFRSSLVFGLVNMIIGYMVLWGFRKAFSPGLYRTFVVASVIAGLVLAALFVASPALTGLWSKSLYSDQIIYETQTPYQRLVLTRDRDDVRLFINGNLQFSTIDEYRYHESLVHTSLGGIRSRLRKVLVLGGGDGLVARELLKYESVDSIFVVDLDPKMTEIARTNNWMRKINRGSLEDPRVVVINTDAFNFVKRKTGTFDVVIADLPDPSNVSLARLYSFEFYQMVHNRLSPGGVFVTQATSPFFSSRAFWSIVATLELSAFEHVVPYHAYVPSFGDWGFVAASDTEFADVNTRIEVPTRYLSPEVVACSFQFAPDLRQDRHLATASTMDNPEVLSAYLKGWRYWK